MGKLAKATGAIGARERIGSIRAESHRDAQRLVVASTGGSNNIEIDQVAGLEPRHRGFHVVLIVDALTVDADDQVAVALTCA